MTLISIVAPCLNEEDNIIELYQRLKLVFGKVEKYQFELIFIDNSSTDNTVKRIKDIASQDKQVKLISNARNFGHVRSPYYGLTQAHGDAVILMATDLQDPPELLIDFIKHWEEGYKVIAAVKSGVKESVTLSFFRHFYYRVLLKLSGGEIIPHFTGFGLYDRSVIQILKTCNEPYPYLRGLISEFGFKIKRVPFLKPARKKGISNNNLYSLYDMAMLGITSHSRLPLRLAIFVGFFFGSIGFLLAIFYLILKLMHWHSFGMGQAPILITILLFGSLQLFFIGLIGEYLLAINARTQKRPLVIENERFNFE